MVRIILIRHGQTEWNQEERFRGRVDIPLDEVGLRQAQATAERLAEYKVTAIYSSPLRRAYTTAEFVARRLNLPVTILDNLIDMSFGTWEGLSIKEAREQDGPLFDKWIKNPEGIRFPEGESIEDVRERAAAALRDVISRHPDETVVLVSHRVICKLLLCEALNIDSSHFWQLAQDTSAINVLEVRDGGMVVTLLNDTCHLNELPASGG